jgi:predicted CXXCH cytochrome family protein
MLWVWIGCTPTNRYKVLSFFFDGVPDPNAPPAGAVQVDQSGRPSVVRTVVYHEPYQNSNCQACHAGGAQTYTPLGALDSRMCLPCHQQVPSQYAVMHGPVAIGVCLWCHAPHESVYPHLL